MDQFKPYSYIQVCERHSKHVQVFKTKQVFKYGFQGRENPLSNRCLKDHRSIWISNRWRLAPLIKLLILPERLWMKGNHGLKASPDTSIIENFITKSQYNKYWPWKELGFDDIYFYDYWKQEIKYHRSHIQFVLARQALPTFGSSLQPLTFHWSALII